MVIMKKLYLGLVLLLMSLVTLSSIPLKAASPIGTTFEFSYETKMGDQAATLAATIPDKAYGSTVTIDGGSLAASGYTFVTYIVNEKVEYSLPAENTFIVTSDLDITAFYKPDGTVMVAFMDTNQDMLKVEYITSGGSATPPSTSGLEKPGLEVSVSTPWSGSYTGVTQDTVLWVVYESAISETYTLTVNNGTGSGTYDYNEVATVTANGTDTFQYWYMNGNIVSLQQTYSFTVVDDSEITAVYTGEASGTNPESLFISLSNPYALKTSYSTYIGQFYLPTGHDIVEFGLIASDTPGDITLATADVEKIRSDKFNAETGEFVRSLLDSSYSSKNIRAYMITTDGVDFTETYSFVNDNLFISEYGESSSYKWIEIYNPNSYAVDLSNYLVKLFSNGSDTATSTADFPSTLIGATDVYVIYYGTHPSFDEEGDLGHSVANFNGNDAILLYKDYPLDQLGTVGDGSVYAEDVTLTRKSAIDTFNQVYTPSEWDSEATTFDYIGSHNPTAPTTITIVGDTTVMDGATINLSIEYPANTIKGVTWESSNELVATVDSSGVVTGESEGTVTITATSTADTNISDTHSVEVTAPITYTVYFDDNEADSNTVSNQTGILSGSTATEPDPAPGKTGFVFDGWYEDEDTWLVPFDFETAITEDTYLYAKWVVESSVTYSSDLFISEYIEGSSNNKVIEIYNNTGVSVNLADYSIVIYSNGSSTPSSTIALSGTLAHGDTFIIANSSSNATILALADMTSGSLGFNGDDAVALTNDGTIIDVIGQIGVDPGSAWTVSGVSTVNMTLVRKSSVIDGDSNGSDAFDPSVEWTAYPTDTTDYLGLHTVVPE